MGEMTGKQCYLKGKPSVFRCFHKQIKGKRKPVNTKCREIAEDIFTTLDKYIGYSPRKCIYPLHILYCIILLKKLLLILYLQHGGTVNCPLRMKRLRAVWK